MRQPFSVNALAQAAGAEAILHSDDVARRVEATIVERVRVESGLDELGIAHAESQTNFSWLDLGDADEAEVVAGLAERSIAVRPGRAAGRARPPAGLLRHCPPRTTACWPRSASLLG